jgi:hypothetical protein
MLQPVSRNSVYLNLDHASHLSLREIPAAFQAKYNFIVCDVEVSTPVDILNHQSPQVSSSALLELRPPRAETSAFVGQPEPHAASVALAMACEFDNQFRERIDITHWGMSMESWVDPHPQPSSSVAE